MKWKASTGEELERWHRWFAWLPIEIGGHWVWLEMIERKGTFVFGPFTYGHRFEYREIGEK